LDQRTKADDELLEMYAAMNDSEKFGVKLGLFPVSCINLSRSDIVKLMELAAAWDKTHDNVETP
jgi:hypothetical protein